MTAPEVSEAALQRQVIDLARLLGWRVAHFRPARTAHGWRTPVEGDAAGFPDLVLTRGHQLLFVELKSRRGRLTAQQREWLTALGRAVEIDVHVWRPADLDHAARILR